MSITTKTIVLDESQADVMLTVLRTHIRMRLFPGAAFTDAQKASLAAVISQLEDAKKDFIEARKAAAHRLNSSDEFETCSCGSDTYLCQVCGEFFCPVEQPPKWETIKLSPTKSFNGNVCPTCQKKEA